MCDVRSAIWDARVDFLSHISGRISHILVIVCLGFLISFLFLTKSLEFFSHLFRGKESFALFYLANHLNHPLIQWCRIPLFFCIHQIVNTNFCLVFRNWIYLFEIVKLVVILIPPFLLFEKIFRRKTAQFETRVPLEYQ